MIKILQIRETPTTKCAGIDANCQGLISLFKGDDSIVMLPTENYTKHKEPILHQCWLDKKEICKSIEHYNPDIVHIHGAYSFTLPLAVACAKKYHKSVVLSCHFHPFYSLRRPLMGRIFFNFITKRVLKKVSLVYTINNEDTVQMSKYNKNVVKVPHWSKYNLTNAESSKQANMILFVGRLNESNKGVEHLYHLPEGKYEIHLVGHGNLKLRSDMIKHEGLSDSELHSLYEKASLLVIPSRYEAFSFVALEALYSNTPIVVSDRVRIVDHLTGIHGYSVFRYKDYDGFCNAVKNTICEKVDVAKVHEVFNPEKIKAIYKRAYCSICK